MIGKTMHNTSFAATCDYVMREGAIHLGSNMVGFTPTELAKEFELLHALRPGISKPVVHIVVALAPEDNLTDEEMLALANRYLIEQGYGNTLFTVWRHLDGTTGHFHAVTSAIDLNGRPISQSFERYRTKRTCRKLETEFDLRKVLNIASPKPDPPPPPPKQDPDGLDVEIPSVSTEVADFFSRLIRQALPACKTFGDLSRALAGEGLSMVPQVHTETREVYGMGYRMVDGPLAGSFIPGSKIPGNFSAAKLVKKHGLSFDPERDLPILAARTEEPAGAVPPAPEPPPPIAAKQRRKKKGERNNARRHRKPHHAPLDPSPWITGQWSLGTFLPKAPEAPGAGLGALLLEHPLGRSPLRSSAPKPLLPGNRIREGWVAKAF